MTLPRSLSRAPSGHPRRGAALMLSIVVLMVILLIVYQIAYTAKTDSRVSRNEEALLWMDESIESVLLQVYEDLKLDAESSGEDAAGGGLGGGVGGGDNPFGGAGLGGGGEGEGDAAAGPTDSFEDEWRRPQRTELNDVRLRILVQDEDSKFNVLSILAEDEDEADAAFERLVRIIDFARGGTEEDVDGGDARRMAEQMLEFLNRRLDQRIPKPRLLSDDPDNEDWGFPLDLREFVVLDEFEEKYFRDFRDERGNVVHSLGSFLTVWSSLRTGEPEIAESGGGAVASNTGQGAPGTTERNDDGTTTAVAGEGGGANFGGGGGAATQDTGGQGVGGGSSSAGDAQTDATRVNVNTAPAAVLKALFDDRDVPLTFWDEVLEYRNEEDEEAEENEEPPLDEFGEEIVTKKIFTDVAELESLDGWSGLEPETQAQVSARLKVTSDVFSIYVTARKPTGVNSEEDLLGDRESLEREETEGTGLVRTVRSVVWRQEGSDGVTIVPLVRWEVLDYVPYEVKDFPEEDR